MHARMRFAVLYAHQNQHQNEHDAPVVDYVDDDDDVVDADDVDDDVDSRTHYLAVACRLTGSCCASLSKGIQTVPLHILQVRYWAELVVVW